MSSGGMNAGPGADQSGGGQSAVGGSNTGMGGPPNTNQLGLDQTGQQSGAGNSGTAGVSGFRLTLMAC